MSDKLTTIEELQHDIIEMIVNMRDADVLEYYKTYISLTRELWVNKKDGDNHPS